MSAVYFIYFGAVGAMAPYMSVYFHSIGLTGTEMGILMSMQPVLLLFSQPVFGPLTDRSGHRGRVLALVLALAGLSGLLIGAGRSFWSLLVPVTLWAFFAGLIGPIADSIALGEMEATGVSYPRLRLWGSIGFLIVAIAVGRLYNVIPLVWSFPIYAAGMLAAVAFARRLPAEGISGRRQAWGELWTLVKNPYLLTFLTLCAVLQMTLAANSAFFSVHFTAIGGSSGMLGWAWGLAALAEVPTWLVLGKIADRTGPLPLLAFAGAAYAVRWWACAEITNPGGLVALALIQSFTYAVFMPIAVLFIGEVMPPHLRTSGQSLLGLVTAGLATLLGTFFAGEIIDRTGTVGMYRLSTWVALASSFGFLVMYLVRKAARRRGEVEARG